MDFSFTEEQLLFQETVRDFLKKEVAPTTIRDSWETETGRSSQLWSQLSELGLTSCMIPVQFGGFGMEDEEIILLAEECGRAALHEPLVETAFVAAPLLAALNAHMETGEWLGKIAQGDAVVAIRHPQNLYVADAHIANLLILGHEDEIHLLTPDQVTMTLQASVDPSRKIFKIDWERGSDTCVLKGKPAQKLFAETFNRAALMCAAQLFGLSQSMLSQSVEYTKQRFQFGKPIGTFQAVKHYMANVAVKNEFVKSVLYRAAHSMSHPSGQTDLHISHAKLAAAEAALLSAKNSIQVHGAIGYTWELDLHIWMKRTWALEKTWGDRGFHKARMMKHLLSEGFSSGAGFTFN